MPTSSKRPACALRMFVVLLIVTLGCSGAELVPPVVTPDFSISAALSPASVMQGSSGVLTVTATRTGGFTGAIAVTVSGLPEGVTAPTATIAASTSSAAVTLTAAQTAAIGAATLTVRGTASAVGERTATTAVTVTEFVGFSISVPSAIRVPAAGEDLLPITVTRMGGFAGSIDISVSGLPSNVNAPNFTIGSTTSNGAVTISTHTGAALSTTGLTVTARSAGQPDRTAPVNLTVVWPFSLQPEEFLVCPTQDFGANGFGCRYRIRKMSDYGLPTLTSFVVQNPGVLHWNRSARVAELANAPAAARSLACTWYNLNSQTYAAPARDYGRLMTGQQQLLISIDNDLMNASGVWVGTRNTTAAEWVVQMLLTLASGEALLAFELQVNSWYDAKRLATVSLNAHYAVEDYPQYTAADKAKVRAWLGQLMTRIRMNDNDLSGYLPSGNDVNNHGWFRDAALMLWGTYTGDNAPLQAAVSRYVSILAGQVRADGSVPNEAARGGVATHYTANAIGHMIQYAEAAALQGHDLYSIKLDGIDVHLMVKFFIDAMEDRSVITKYAERQLYCSPEQCSTWSTQDLSSVNADGWNMASWSEAYVRRFPGSQNAQRLVALYPRATYKKLVSDTFGLNASCAWRALNP